MRKIEVGSVVTWLGSPYTVVRLEKNGALLRQNFSIGVVLNSPVPLDQLKF